MIGFSTGCLYKEFNPVSKEAIEIIRSTGCDCIEICVGLVERIDSLDLLNKKDFEDFSFISLHMPCDVRYSNNPETKNLFDKVFKANCRLNFDSIVLHPDLVDDWEFICCLNLPFSIENMDSKKKSFKTVEEMQERLSKNNLGFVLDLNHVFTNDSSMNLARDFYDSFKERLCEFHISGHSKEEGKSHYLLFLTKQNEILTDITIEKPIIIESVLFDYPYENKKEWAKEQLKKELKYVMEVVVRG